LKTIDIVVTPKAASNRVVESEDGKSLRVYVTTVPEDGKANKAVLKLLSKHLKISKSALTIVRGATSRQKSISIDE